MADYTVEIENVSKRYATHVAVRDLTLRVPKGSVYGLLGPNGAGKTTTIRMVLNIIAPDEGTIRILGVPFNDPKITDRVGYLPEERGLYRKMQVRRILRFLAELKGVPRAVADKRITEWLERLDLKTAEKDWGLSKIDELSRGMQQKVQFIGTLLHDPELVILDEPFSGLDPINAQALKDTIIDLRRRGKTVIFSTHLMDNAERICDSVCILARGEKVLDGSIVSIKNAHGARNIALSLEGGSSNGVGEILSDPRLVSRVDDSNLYFEIELAENAKPQDLLRRIVDSGASVQRFELVQPSLHQIFLEKVGARTRLPSEGPFAEGVESGITGHG
jgi:ABC-2 type transport system ATP-binding protein